MEQSNKSIFKHTVCAAVWLIYLVNGHTQSPAASPTTSGAPLQITLSAKQQASLGIQVAAVHASQTGPLLVSATVTTPPGKEFTVSAPYAGQISRLMVGVGDSVKAGSELAQFTSPMLGDARRLLNEAKLEAHNATAAVQRDQAMFDEGIIPAVRLQLSLSKQEAAQALLLSRQAELSSSGMRFDAGAGYATGTLRAPLAGEVLEAMSSVGQRVEAGTVLFKLADSKQLQLDMQLSIDKANQLQVGDQVVVGSRNAQAKIIGVSRAVDNNQSARARATVTQRGSLQVGEFVPVIIHTHTHAHSNQSGAQWLIPSRSITQWKGKSIAFAVHAKGFAVEPLKILSATDDLSLVEAAWGPHTQLAITGISALRALLQKDE